MNRLKAVFILAIHFWKHVLAKATLRYDRGGEARFVDNYRADRLLPLERDARERLADWQRCIGCGLCDAVCPSAAGETGPGPQLIVGAGLRDLSAMHTLVDEVEALADCAECDDCHAVCPVDVPVADVLRFVAARARALS